MRRYRPLIAGVLGVSLLSSCGGDSSSQQPLPSYFTTFDELDELIRDNTYQGGSNSVSLDIEFADLDGDGDMDLAMSSRHGESERRVFENRIPQGRREVQGTWWGPRGFFPYAPSDLNATIEIINDLYNTD